MVATTRTRRPRARCISSARRPARASLRSPVMMSLARRRGRSSARIQRRAMVFRAPASRCHRDASEVGVTEQGVRCLKIVLPTSGLPGGATRLGELTEDVQGVRDLTGDGDRIERRELGVERGALSGGEDPRGEDPLVRSPWGVVAFVDTAADPALAQEFADGAEEVVVEAQQGVEALQGGPRRAGAVAVIADEATDQQAIALLDPGLVIFAIRAPPRKAHALPLAPAEQGRIDELAAVVTVPGADRKGQAGRHVLDGARDPLVMQIPQPLQFGPGGGDVDGDERDTVPAGGGLPAVQDEIALQGAGLYPRPLAPGTQGHLGAERTDRGGQAPGLPGPAAAQWAQQPIQRRGAGREQGRAHRRSQDDPVVPLQSRDQRGQDGAQELPRELITGHPDALEHGQQVAPIAGRPARCAAASHGGGAQATNRGLAMTSGDPAVLIQQRAPLLFRRLLIPLAHYLGILATSSLRHGAPFPVAVVTPVLR